MSRKALGILPALFHGWSTTRLLYKKKHPCTVLECLRCSDYDMISTHRLFKFSKQNRVSYSMRKPKYQLLVLKWKSTSRNLKNTKIRANKRLRCEMRVENNNRLRSGYECCCCCCCCCRCCCRCCCCCVCALCSTTVMRRLSIDAVCVGRAARCACSEVTRPRALSTTTFFADRSLLRQKQKKHSEHSREHAAVVRKTHDGVIDVASAPCQDTAA